MAKPYGWTTFDNNGAGMPREKPRCRLWVIPSQGWWANLSVPRKRKG